MSGGSYRAPQLAQAREKDADFLIFGAAIVFPWSFLSQIVTLGVL